MMKQSFFLIAIFLIGIYIMGCKYQYPTDPISSVNPGIAMKVNNTTFRGGDTTEVERWVKVHFVGEALGGAQIIHWEWVIYGLTIPGKSVEYTFNAQPITYTTVKVRGTDVNNVVHQDSVIIKIVHSVDGQSDIIIVSSNSAGGSYNIVFAFKKAGMSYAAGSQYFYTGNVTNPIWTPILVNVADTNYNFVSGQLVNPAPSVGKYIRVPLTLNPGSYEMAVGKIISGQQFWGTFFDTTLIKFTLNADGTVNLAGGPTPTNYPGTMGDTGPEAVVRWEFLDDRAVLYIKNNGVFSGLNAFVRFQDSTGTWQAPLPQRAVPNFPNWGARDIMYNTLPTKNLLVFNFGSQMAQPLQFNVNANKSQYWDKNFMVLKAMIIRNDLGQPIRLAPLTLDQQSQ